MTVFCCDSKASELHAEAEMQSHTTQKREPMLSAGAGHHTEPHGLVNLHWRALRRQQATPQNTFSTWCESQCSLWEVGYQTGPKLSCFVMPSKRNNHHHQAWNRDVLSCHQNGKTNTIKHGSGMLFHAVEREQPTPSNIEQACLCMPSQGNKQHHQTRNRDVFSCHQKATTSTSNIEQG